MGIGYGNHEDETTKARGDARPAAPAPAEPAPVPGAAAGGDVKPDSKTPGQGSLPAAPQGDEVDPGVG